MKALIIEDDYNLSGSIASNIRHMFETDQAYDGEEGLYFAMDDVYDIIILDIMLPKMDGYELLEKLREKGITTPVLLLTAKDGIDDKIRGFESGADDYLTKPFHREELLLRTQAILRRTTGVLEKEVIQFEEISLHTANRKVYIQDVPVDLPGKQFDILEYFILNKDVILTKEQVFNRVWGFESDTTTNVIEVYTSNLRKNLKPYGCDKYIETIRGVGYLFSKKGGGAE